MQQPRHEPETLNRVGPPRSVLAVRVRPNAISPEQMRVVMRQLCPSYDLIMSSAWMAQQRWIAKVGTSLIRPEE